MIAHGPIDADSLILIESISIDHTDTTCHVALCLHRDQRVSRLNSYNLFFSRYKEGESRTLCVYCVYVILLIRFPDFGSRNKLHGWWFIRKVYRIYQRSFFLSEKRQSFMSSLDRELQNYNHPVRP